METDIQPLDWHRLLLGDAPPLYYAEIALRVLILFGVLLLVLRLMGKREQDSLSPMQQMLMIALGSAAGDVMLYPTIAIGYAVMVLVGVTLLTVVMENLANASQPVRDYLESEPTVLLHKGRVNYDALKTERTTERELFASLRLQGAVSLSQVEVAILEVTGGISVILNDDKPKDRDLVDYLLDRTAKKPSQENGNPAADS